MSAFSAAAWASPALYLQPYDRPVKKTIPIRREPELLFHELFTPVTLKANGTMRFCDIQKTIGDISQRMLTVTLRSLEADGLVVREVYAEIPPRVEYSLTETGLSLMPHVESLVGWALEHMDDILRRRHVQIG